jgi:hypothetical protein
MEVRVVGCVEPWVLLVVVVGSRWWCVVKGVVVEWKQVWNMVGDGGSVVKVVVVGRKRAWRMVGEVESVSMVVVASPARGSR